MIFAVMQHSTMPSRACHLRTFQSANHSGTERRYSKIGVGVAPVDASSWLPCCMENLASQCCCSYYSVSESRPGQTRLLARFTCNRVGLCDPGLRCFIWTRMVPHSRGHCKDLRVKSDRSSIGLTLISNIFRAPQNARDAIAASDLLQPMRARPVKIRPAVL